MNATNGNSKEAVLTWPRDRHRLFRYTLFLAAACVLCALLPASSGVVAEEPRLSPMARFQGEELYYSLEFLGAQTARAALVMGEVGAESEDEIIHIFGLAETTGVAAMIFPLRDTGSTNVHAVSGLPARKEVELDERGEYRHYEVTFDHGTYDASIVRQRGDRTNRYHRAVPSNTHDAFTWIYAVRDQNLTPDTTYIYFVFDGWKLSRVHVTVLRGHEEALVGDEFVRCRRLSLFREVLSSSRPLPFIQETADLPPAMWVQETQAGEQVGELWISDDDRRLPTQIVFQNELVSVTARLASYQPPSGGY